MTITRLWHFATIPFIPNSQLRSQWRELVCIAKSIYEKGTPNHILVNKTMKFPLSDLNKYCNIVLAEMLRRGYNVKADSIHKLETYINFTVDSEEQFSHPFQSWHNERYLLQNYYNLQEKWDCEGVSMEEWKIYVDGCCRITEREFLP